MCHHGAGYGAGPGIEQGLINMAAQVDSAIQKIGSPRVGIGEEQEDLQAIQAMGTYELHGMDCLQIFSGGFFSPLAKYFNTPLWGEA